MIPAMKNISEKFSCNLLTFVKKDKTKVLSLSVGSQDKIRLVISYFNTYPLLGVKKTDFAS